jgi:hypothetical protein
MLFPFLKQITVNNSKSGNAKTPMFTGISWRWPKKSKRRKRWFYDFESEGELRQKFCDPEGG